MKLHDLKPRHKSRKDRKRVGRGISAGQGKTAGRGTKGEGARSGSGGKLYRQGGNLPFFRRLPFKRGFSNPFQTTWNEVNLDQLEGLEAGTHVTPDLLAQGGLLKSPGDPIALLGRGNVSTALEIHVHRVTKAARKKVEAAGGKVHLIEPPPDPKEGWNEVQLGDLRDFDDDAVITPGALSEAGLLKDPEAPVMIIGRGDLRTPLTVRVHRVSRSARAQIVAAGGTVEPVEDQDSVQDEG